MPLTSSSQNSLASLDEEGIGYALMGVVWVVDMMFKAVFGNCKT